jgi:PAS domain S-box-containing protein
MSLHDDDRIQERLRSVADPVGFLVNLFAHVPVGLAVWTADGHPLLTNRAFMDLFGSEPPPEYNVLQDDILAANGMLALFQRAFAGETVQVPTMWFDPRELKTVTVTTGRRVAISMTIFPLFKSTGEIEFVAATYKDETEMRLALERLEYSEARFRGLADTGIIGILTADTHGSILSANAAFLEMVGYTWEELISISWIDMTPSDWRHLDDRAIAQLRTTGVADPWEKEYFHKDGSRIPVLVGVAMLGGGAGTAIAFVLDLSERKRAELAARESSARKSAVMEAALDAIVVMDHHGNIREFNATAEEMFGYRREEVVGKPLAEILIPLPLRLSHSAGLARYLATGTKRVLGQRLEVPVLRRDGTEFPAEVAVVRIATEGDPVFTGFIRDITDRRRAAEAALLRREKEAVQAANAELEARVIQRTAELAGSEQRLATTLLSIGDAVIATDTDARVTRMNPVAEALTGWWHAEAAGRPLTDVFRIHEEGTGQVIENPAARVLREGTVVGLANHTMLVSRDGVTRPIADSCAPIRDASGAIHGAVLVFRDMTADRAAENERLRAIELAAENRQVREASRMKSEFLANMSHELRTPLNSIIGFSELLHDEEVGDPADQKEFLGNILASGRHLLRLINDVLDLSKVEAGKIELRPEPVEPATVLTEVIAIIHESAAARGVRLTTTLDESLGQVIVDPARLKQVLYNYLSNAIKFTPANGTVEARILAVSADRFQIEVEDSGIGIAQEDLPRLFVEFEQLDAGATKRHGGTGLGLALTKRIVEAQGGDVSVTSVVGRGSIFRASLPRRPKVPSREMPAVDPASASAVASNTAVLVVEDDAGDRKAIVGALRAAGYLVDVAETAAIAIAKCRECAYLAITLDLILPDGSGLDVLRALRADGPNRDVKVIVVTVAGEPGAVAGFAVTDILVKPLDTDALVAALHRAGVPIRSGEVWVIDDDECSRKLMAATLEQLGLQSTGFADAATALRRLEQVMPLAIVVDLLMPDMDGFELIERLRAVEACSAVPIIVWTVKDLSVGEYDRLRTTVQLVLAKGSGAGAGLASVMRAILLDG